jgi:hypothetical protein
MTADDWQLELLCNVSAAELLMPIGSFPDVPRHLSIDSILSWRKQFDVSVEAVVLRAIHLTSDQCVAFSASVRGPGMELHYFIDYSVASRGWGSARLPSGTALPRSSAVTACTAIGHTVKSSEDWPRGLGPIHLECVGLPPFPNQLLPRVVGIIAPQDPSPTISNNITYLIGDATSPHGSGGVKVIAQIANDKAITWGGGFALAARKKWRAAQDDYRRWASSRVRRWACAPADSAFCWPRAWWTS